MDTVFGKVTIYAESGAKSRASVYLNSDGSFNAMEFRKELFSNAEDFASFHTYSVIVSSDENIRRAMSEVGFVVRDIARVNKPLHLMLPGWQIAALDTLCKDKYINFSRSDLINKVILDNLPSIPPEYPYEKNMSKTTFTINPVALNGIESFETSRTRNHLIYDYISEFLERNACN